MATNPDFTQKQAEAGVWSLVELNMGIVCNNLMRLKPFLRTYLPRVLTFLGLTAKSKQQGEIQSKSSGNWGSRPSHSYQLNSLEHDDPHHSSFRKEPSVDETGFGDSDKEPSRHNGSTDDILRSSRYPSLHKLQKLCTRIHRGIPIEASINHAFR
ncbi:uncharacterized protein FTJAE_687 [Fusarium tjaetaba]|uniref:Integral membrane protein n=1 Tax=Fusarium tjaetaba TaxID=1567544 RepID=A0A8H5SG39_9HYPO|nr:uncharacterized protein FTJAE_687 [Fusarium tjaetaba]KAF5650122.1 integral membrane protein [Fusarium tjaetaba]